MKTSKVFGAIALSAALVMGTVPAFAALPTVGDQKDTYNITKSGTEEGKDLQYTGENDTVVKGETYVVQLNVTVPMEVKVALPATGTDIIFPSTDAYKIYNNGDVQTAYVQDVKAVAKGSFKLGAHDADAKKAGIKLKIDSKDIPEDGTALDLDYAIGKKDSLGIQLAGTVDWVPNTVTMQKELSGQAFEVAQLQYTISTVQKHPAVVAGA